MRKYLFFIILSLFALTGCDSMQKYDTQFYDVFDTVSSLSVYAKNEEEAKQYQKAVHERLLELHRLCDPYNGYDGINNIKAINEAKGAELEISDDLHNMIEYGINAHKKTDGAINIALGATLEIWHRYRSEALEGKEAAIPTKEELESTRALDNISAVELTKNGVRITKSGTALDLGATAKGYAADEALKLLKEMGCDSALINLGGNVGCYSGSAHNKPWKVGVQDALDPDGLSDVIEISDGFVVSSGNYQRFYMYNGKKMHHIIDPETLMPAEGMSGTTVVCGSGADGDMLSTALFILPKEKGIKLAEEYGAQRIYLTDADGRLEKYPAVTEEN